ncbi:hypothetical protein HUK65_14715 [Rhodobacteraceae bacterium 2376]|uniref:Uncharacterized protein n=2 Tax=Rhabdonatronobacter sediminivivens TaxID=2743469 RepID=A0A7Z0KZH4_9RHOB|nr:hypothetical protein [Rhabdonatronobacter sediminivivens]
MHWQRWFAHDPNRPRAFTLGATGWAHDPRALTSRFAQTLDEGRDATQAGFHEGRPVLLHAKIDTPAGGLIRVAVPVGTD